MSDAAPGHRRDYRWFHAITTRWMDNDLMGHVNNAVYYSWFDTAVTRYELAEDVVDLIAGPLRCVVAESQCRFHRSIAFPDAVTVGLRAARIGARSVTYELGVFRNDEDHAAAEGRFVHVFVDGETWRPVDIPLAARERLGLIA